MGKVMVNNTHGKDERQILASLDRRSAVATLQSARITLATARTTLQDDIDNGDSDSTILSARQAVINARQAVLTAGQAVRDDLLVAPLDGTVTAINGIVGQGYAFSPGR